MKSKHKFIFSLLCVFFFKSVCAQQVNAIYTADVPVLTQSDDDKKEAIREGLAQVFIKVTGNSRIFEDYAALQKTLDEANVLVSEITYAQPDASSKLSILHLKFNHDKIDAALNEAGASVWPIPRPLVLAWIVLDTPDHPADLLGNDADTQIQTLLKTIAQKRGLKMIVPVMDIESINEVTLADVDKKNLSPILKASKRYGNSDLLIGTVKKVGNEMTSDWLLVTDDNQYAWKTAGLNIDEVFTDLTNDVTDQLVTDYFASLNTQAQTQVLVMIGDIHTPDTLIKLIQSLQSMTAVADVKLIETKGDDIKLNVSLRGTRDAFLKSMQAMKNIRASEIPSESADVISFKLLHKE